MRSSFNRTSPSDLLASLRTLSTATTPVCRPPCVPRRVILLALVVTRIAWLSSAVYLSRSARAVAVTQGVLVSDAMDQCGWYGARALGSAGQREGGVIARCERRTS